MKWQWLESFPTQWENPGSNPTVAWYGASGPTPSRPISAGRGELSMCGDSKRCSAGGKSSGRGCQPHFTKPLLVLRGFLLHHDKCLTFWNMSKKEDFPASLSGLWFSYHRDTRRCRFKLSSMQVFPSPMTSLPGNWKVSQPPLMKFESQVFISSCVFLTKKKSFKIIPYQLPFALLPGCPCFLHNLPREALAISFNGSSEFSSQRNHFLSKHKKGGKNQSEWY